MIHFKNWVIILLCVETLFFQYTGSSAAVQTGSILTAHESFFLYSTLLHYNMAKQLFYPSRARSVECHYCSQSIHTGRLTDLIMLTGKAVASDSNVMFALRIIPGFTRRHSLPCLHAPVLRKRTALLSWFLASVATPSQSCNNRWCTTDPEISLFSQISTPTALGMLEKWSYSFSKVMF